MVHRALLGSLERFFGILVEHYGGAFPVWLAPEQVRVLPITDKQNEFVDLIMTSLRKAGVRVDADRKSDKLGAKIRRAQTQKVPYMLIVGPKEAEGGMVSVRSRSDGDLGVMLLDEFVGKVEVESRI
jgi:threonyl-tRNA synthetase